MAMSSKAPAPKNPPTCPINFNDAPANNDNPTNPNIKANREDVKIRLKAAL
jgi:hypothetical protein